MQELAASCSSKDRPEGETYSIPAAARQIGVPARTLYSWVETGKVPTLPPGLGERGVRIAAATVEELRRVRPIDFNGEQLLPQDAAGRNESGDEVAGDGGGVQEPAAASCSSMQIAELHAQVARLETERDGARLACRLHAQARSRLEAEAAWLRGQVEQSRQAEEQLRILAAQAVRSLEAVTQRPALEGGTRAPARRWWPWLRRG